MRSRLQMTILQRQQWIHRACRAFINFWMYLGIVDFALQTFLAMQLFSSCPVQPPCRRPAPQGKTKASARVFEAQYLAKSWIRASLSAGMRNYSLRPVL